MRNGSDTSLSCTSTGAWTGSISCVGIQCSVPPQVANAQLGSPSNGGRFPSSVSYKCAEGFEFDGSDGKDPANICNSDGTWSDFVKCRRRACKQAPVGWYISNNKSKCQYSKCTIAVGFYPISGGSTLDSCKSAACTQAPAGTYYTSSGDSSGNCPYKDCTNALEGQFYTGNHRRTNACPVDDCQPCPDGWYRTGCGGKSQGTCHKCSESDSNCQAVIEVAFQEKERESKQAEEGSNWFDLSKQPIAGFWENILIYAGTICVLLILIVILTCGICFCCCLCRKKKQAEGHAAAPEDDVQFDVVDFRKRDASSRNSGRADPVSLGPSTFQQDVNRDSFLEQPHQPHQPRVSARASLEEVISSRPLPEDNSNRSLPEGNPSHSLPEGHPNRSLQERRSSRSMLEPVYEDQRSSNSLQERHSSRSLHSNHSLQERHSSHSSQERHSNRSLPERHSSHSLLQTVLENQPNRSVQENHPNLSLHEGHPGLSLQDRHSGLSLQERHSSRSLQERHSSRSLQERHSDHSLPTHLSPSHPSYSGLTRPDNPSSRSIHSHISSRSNRSKYSTQSNVYVNPGGRASQSIGQPHAGRHLSHHVVSSAHSSHSSHTNHEGQPSRSILPMRSHHSREEVLRHRDSASHVSIESPKYADRDEDEDEIVESAPALKQTTSAPAGCYMPKGALQLGPPPDAPASIDFDEMYVSQDVSLQSHGSESNTPVRSIRIPLSFMQTPPSPPSSPLPNVGMHIR